MGKKIIRLTESDLKRIVERVIQEEENMAVSTKGSLSDIAKKNFIHKSDFPAEYKWMLTPDYVWEVVNARGVKVGGVPNPTGKQFKSKDFIEITNGDGELTFVPKGELAKIKRGDMGVMFGVDLGDNGIRVTAAWD